MRSSAPHRPGLAAGEATNARTWGEGGESAAVWQSTGRVWGVPDANARAFARSARCRLAQPVDSDPDRHFTAAVFLISVDSSEASPLVISDPSVWDMEYSTDVTHGDSELRKTPQSETSSPS